MGLLPDHCRRLLAGATLVLVAATYALAGDDETGAPVACEDVRSGLYGYCDARGAVVLPPRFAIAMPFSARGLAAVVDEHGWVYIDRSGREVIRPFVFDNGPDDFREGVARYQRDGKIGYFDEAGAVVIDARFAFARPFHEGRAAFCEGCEQRRIGGDGEHAFYAGGRWGFIDRSGHPVVSASFDEVEDFRDGKARVRRGEVWLLIDRGGAVHQPGARLSAAHAGAVAPPGQRFALPRAAERRAPKPTSCGALGACPAGR